MALKVRLIEDDWIYDMVENTVEITAENLPGRICLIFQSNTVSNGGGTKIQCATLTTACRINDKTVILAIDQKKTNDCFDVLTMVPEHLAALRKNALLKELPIMIFAKAGSGLYPKKEWGSIQFMMTDCKWLSIDHTCFLTLASNLRNGFIRFQSEWKEVCESNTTPTKERLIRGMEECETCQDANEITQVFTNTNIVISKHDPADVELLSNFAFSAYLGERRF
jgi:hypothetical protein